MTTVSDTLTRGPLSGEPTDPPQSEFIYEAMVEIGESRALGVGPLGERRIVPILGGIFAGPRLNGTVVPGGADRQLIRADGMKELDALYELETTDGAVLTVRNRVLIDTRAEPAAPIFSRLDVTAPAGPHDWVNRRVLVGRLRSLRPQPRVLIRVYALV